MKTESTKKHRLRQMLRGVRSRMKRSRMRHTTFLAVTGSCAKTSTTHFLAKILSDHSLCFVGIHDNSENSIMRNLKRAKGTPQFFLQEVSGDAPGKMMRNVRLLRPDIGIVTVVGQDHYRNFRTLENTAQEKGILVESLPPSGVAVLNADDPHVIAMAQRTSCRVITYGRTDGADVLASDIRSVWPDRLSVAVSFQGQTFFLRTGLFSDLLLGSVLAAITGGIAAGVEFQQCVESLQGIETFPRRMSIQRTALGAWFISDTGKAPWWGVAKVLSLVDQVKAPRKTMVFGTFSDMPGSDSGKYRSIAKKALKIVDRVVFTGPKSIHIRKLLTPETFGRLFMVESEAEAARLLGEEVVPDELIFIKSGNRDHLERLVYSQDQTIGCWKVNCPKTMDCRHCSASGLLSDKLK